MVNFEYNNRNYTSIEENKGLTVDPKKESLDDLLKYVENGNTSQAHIATTYSKVYAVYVLIDNGQLYFSTEELIDLDSSVYGVTIEEKNESKTIVHFNQKMWSTLFLTILVIFIASFIVFAQLWVKKPPDSETS
ncbi:MAG: hypothetical protein U9P70_01085 [Patescibacteria group bacterium]|nr:hypothetical protein [Patescibacteria group bacterium]